MLEELRKDVWKFHKELKDNNLVFCSNGNVSIRYENYIIIKPSGIPYDNLTLESMVVVDIHGNVIEGKLKPSVDTPTHLYIYRNRPDILGIVHTHSIYATAFAAAGKPIPTVLTSIVDEFGGAIPCGGYAKVGTEDIGKMVLDSIGTSSTVLLKHHGVFSLGKSGYDAVKAAITTENCAKTVLLASLLGTLKEIPKSEVERAHSRYKKAYGQ